MTRPVRGDTEARASGFDAKMEAGFAWVAEHLRMVLIVLGVLLLAGVSVAISYEIRTSSENEAQLALALVEAGFARAMGSSVSDALVVEPANEAQATRGREEALGRFEAVVLDHRGTRAAQLAQLRAAEMEVDLARWRDAEARLGQLAGGVSGDDILRAMALRLMGFALEQQGRFEEAGESYVRAGAVERYPVRGGLFIAAGASFARAGAVERAIAAFQRAVSLDPELAEREGVVDRLGELSALSG